MSIAIATVLTISGLLMPSSNTAAECNAGETTLVAVRSTALSSEAFPGGASFGARVAAGQVLCAIGPLIEGENLQQGRSAWPLVDSQFVGAQEVAQLPTGWDSEFPERRVVVPSTGLFGSGAQELRSAPSRVAEKATDVPSGAIVDANPAATVTDANAKTWVPVRLEGGTVGWLQDSALTAELPKEATLTTPAAPTTPTTSTEAPTSSEAPPLEVPRLAIAVAAIVSLILVLVGVSVLARRRKANAAEPESLTTTVQDDGLPPAPLNKEI